MFFAEKIRELREQHRIPQRELAAELRIDTATYCKIERGDRKAKREQVLVLARLLHVDECALTKLWLADQVYSIIKEENNAVDILNLVAREYPHSKPLKA